MSNGSDVQKLADSVTSLQKDMMQIGSLVDRLDVTIEKLTEVSSTVSQLLAVQGSRLEFQEKVAEKLQDLVEKRREETDHYIRDVYKQIEKVERDLHEDMEENNTKVLDQIEKLSLTSQQQHKEMNDRMARFEKWMWTALGATMVFVLLFNNILGLSKIFN